MKIAIVDADLIGRVKHRFPNLASMKISAYHKDKGDSVSLVTNYDELDGYDHIYLSKVFTDTDVPQNILTLDNLSYGGTGFFYDEAPPLPTEIEHMKPDYHLYDDWVQERMGSGGKAVDFKYYTDYSIGFVTRGCFRQCPFCVNRNYRKVEIHSPLQEFLDKQRPKICLLDDNFFGCAEWKRILTGLQETGKPFQFKQGLDERLLTEDKCEMLFSSKYDGDYIFAFDNVADSELIEKKLQLIRRYTTAIPKFYTFCGFDREDRWDESFWKQDLWDLWKRIEILMRYNCLPYIMRFNRYVESPYAGMYITLARWCNQPSFFKKKSFREFVYADQGERTKEGSSLRYMKQIEAEIPELAHTYFDMKYGETASEVRTQKMRIFVYDCEVFLYNWLVVFKDIATKEYTVIHNDSEELRSFMDSDSVYIGFNSKSYDQFIIKAIGVGATNEEIKELNDYLISGEMGWEHPMMRFNRFWFNNVDIRDDVYKALSLKAIEGHLGMSVEESNVPFDLDRPLTPDELEETIRYCKHDVDATERLVEVRKDYLQTKINLGARVGIPSEKAMAMTNAKLTASILKAVRREWSDGRDYVYPSNLELAMIPQDILDFFDTIHDQSIPDEELFKTEFRTVIGDMPCKFAWGGVHGSLLAYHEESQGTRVIQNRDVSSLYPSLIEEYNYLSRNVPDPEIFYSIRKERIEAKHKGDSQTAKDLKLPLNTVSGAQENRYNDLYDPLPTRSMRISGQLFLTVLTVKLLNACKTIRLLNLNTDGLMYSVDKSELHIVDAICAEWEKITRFELETDEISRVWIKDVNNLLLEKTNGKVKTVGGYLNYGISVKGAWAINNNAIIVKQAVVNYFVHGTPVEETINTCNDIMSFQLIAKAGQKYREAYHLVDGEKQPVQRVNRVYATADERYGKLFKVKAEDDSTAKIEMLPDHCIIDNGNRLTIDDVDKTFYINLAKKRINDYLGIKPERVKKERKKKSMATASKTPVSIHKRLAIVREKFLAHGIKKNGKNIQLKSLHFTLEDIVPVSTPLFHEQNLIPLVNFTATECTLDIVDMDDADLHLTFTAPMREYNGNAAVTPVQALGATITYMRRYLYQQALDIVETDDMEEGTLPTTVKPAAPKAPVSEEKREEVKQNLTNPEGNATSLQITQLKKKLKELLAADKSKEEWVAELAVETQSFTTITKSRCEEVLMKVSELLASKEG